MNAEMFNIKEYSLNVQLESLDTAENILPFDTLIRFFSKLKQSFRCFVEIEFLKNEEFRKIYLGKPGILESFKKDFDLMIVFLNLETLQASIAPDLIEHEESLFQHEIFCWKREKFNVYKEDVIYLDYHDSQAVKKIFNKYTASERVKIYKPVFDVISYDKNYKVNLLDPTDKICGMILPPPDIIKKQIIQAPQILKTE